MGATSGVTAGALTGAATGASMGTARGAVWALVYTAKGKRNAITRFEINIILINQLFVDASNYFSLLTS
jgi:hypothetical protein